MSPALAPASIDMLQTVMRPSIESASDGRAAVLDDVADAAAGADAAEDGQDDVLGRAAGGQVAVDGDGQGLGGWLRQGLGGEDVLDLAGADAERQRAEGAVGGGVGVAADDGHAGLREALLRADDVDDALAGRVHRVQGDAELGAVVAQRLDLLAARSGRRSRRSVSWVGTLWSSVAIGELGVADAAAGEAQAVERLRAGDLVDEVEVDEEQVGLARASATPRGRPRPSG